MRVNIPQNRTFSFWASAFTVFLCMIFGANTVAIKISLAGLGVFTTAGIRFSLAAAAIFLWARLTHKSFRIKKGKVGPLLVVCVSFTIQLSLFYLGLNKTHASRGALMVNLLPFFVLFLAHFFIPGDRINRHKLGGMLLAFVGVGFVFWDWKELSSALRVGDSIVLLAALFWSGNVVYVKKIIDDFEPFQLVMYPMIFAVPFYFLGAWLFDDPMVTRFDTVIFGSLLYQSLITAAFGFVAWNTMLQKYGAVSLHSFVFIMPVAGVVLGGLVLGEPLTWNILVALALIATGILVVHSRPQKMSPVFPLGRGY
jgi:drug/metabolite transporter (DMT)-like permease